MTDGTPIPGPFKPTPKPKPSFTIRMSPSAKMNKKNSKMNYWTWPDKPDFNNPIVTILNVKGHGYFNFVLKSGERATK